MDKPRCPVCNSQQTALKYKPEITSGSDVSFSYTFSPSHNRVFGVVRCRGCGHVFCSPIPSNLAENYVDVVDEEYLKHQASRETSALAVVQELKGIPRVGSCWTSAAPRVTSSPLPKARGTRRRAWNPPPGRQPWPGKGDSSSIRRYSRTLRRATAKNMTV